MLKYFKTIYDDIELHLILLDMFMTFKYSVGVDIVPVYSFLEFQAFITWYFRRSVKRQHLTFIKIDDIIY